MRTPAVIKSGNIQRRSHFKRIDLQPAEAKKWDETLAACNWVAPGFIHIMYSMLVPKGRTMAALFTEQLPYTAATDGFQLIFKPSRFFQYTLMKRVFIVVHEIMHNIFDHCGMGFRMRKAGFITWEGITVPYVPLLANIIQDCIINDSLIESRLGEYDADWIHDKKVAVFTDSWVERYVKLYKECASQGGRGRGKGLGAGQVEDVIEEKYGAGDEQPDEGNTQDGDGPARPGKGQFDLHLDPGSGGSGSGDDEKDDGDEQGQGNPIMRERSELEWQQAVAAGMAVAKAQGKLPAAMELLFGEILEPTVDWKDHIRALFARKVGSGGYDYRKPDRRLIVRDIVAPGRSGHGAKTIVVGGDNSGSIYADPTLLGRFLGEVGGILEDLNPEEIIVIWCDAMVREVDHVSDPQDIALIQRRGTTGGGGTSFVPVFQWVEDHNIKPDALVYLTDMMGTFPDEEPGYPVIWATISPIDQHPAPWGDQVFIPTIDAEHR